MANGPNITEISRVIYYSEKHGCLPRSEMKNKGRNCLVGWPTFTSQSFNYNSQKNRSIKT